MADRYLGTATLRSNRIQTAVVLFAFLRTRTRLDASSSPLIEHTSRVEFSQRHPFSQWPDGGVPAVSAGVYAIWRGDELVYCGMSGRGIGDEHVLNKKKYGLVTRLASHATGRLSGDQFCVYVANRFVVPDLTASDLNRFASGEMTLDRLTKTYIHQHLDYQYVIVDSSAAAFELERKARRGEVFGVMPLLNPL